MSFGEIRKNNNYSVNKNVLVVDNYNISVFKLSKNNSEQKKHENRDIKSTP